MRFICVTLHGQLMMQDRTTPYPCAICTTPIGKSYVRDLATRLVYHNQFCLDNHVAQTTLAIEDAARRTS